MYKFDYHAPASRQAAITLARDNDESQFLAGGMTLLPVMKLRLASPDSLISLAGVPDLEGVEVSPSTISIGAMTRHADVAADPAIREHCSALSALAGLIGDPQVRNRGTLGGSLATNHPAADYPAAVLALDALITTDRRVLKADEFFKGLFETALEAGELITEVAFKVPDAAAYEKFPDPASRYAIVGVFVARFGSDVRLAVTGAGDHAFRYAVAEGALAADFSVEALNDVSLDSAELLEDLHANSDYRAHLINVLARNAVKRLLG
jgi:carbon-monoxide dehydrogenase medium subunit